MVGKEMTLILVLQIIIITFVQITIAKGEITLEAKFCSKSENVRRSIYNENMISLFNTLTKQSSKSMFLETSYGNGVDRVNGMYVCRPDITLDTCNACVASSIDLFSKDCSINKEAFVWYHECMVRYSNLRIAATLEMEPSNTNMSPLDVSETDMFPAIRRKTLEGIISEASMAENKIRFAYNNTGLIVFGMGWCIPDIKPADCKSCLKTALTRIPEDSLAQWGSVVYPSCVLKYDTVPFIFSSKSRSLLAPSKTNSFLPPGTNTALPPPKS